MAPNQANGTSALGNGTLDSRDQGCPSAQGEGPFSNPDIPSKPNSDNSASRANSNDSAGNNEDSDYSITRRAAEQ